MDMKESWVKILLDTNTAQQLAEKYVDALLLIEQLNIKIAVLEEQEELRNLTRAQEG